MIAGVNGKLESMGSGWAIINVGGISFRIYMSTTTMSMLGAIGNKVHLHTHLHLREDNVTLYGFASADELSLFQILIGVSGIGPKLALSMLSAMSAEQLAIAIATGSTNLLTDIPGIGKRTADRIILELKDKIGAGWVTTPAVELAQENAEVVDALTSLGYSLSEASRAVATLPHPSNLSLEEKIKLVLQYFASK